jgi:XTP/dITP diphosphohydrolase
LTPKLCFATNNRHKLEEVASLLNRSFDLVGLHEVGFKGELEEDFFTLEENSKQKATFVFNNFHIPCFADDSGLEVDALNGEPGVHSAHFAGPHRSSADNTDLLLKKMEGIENRSARFRTVITLMDVGLTKQFEGIVKGKILHTPRGTEGFGYDPVFLPDGFEISLAEMTMSQKNKISHRAMAVFKLVEFLKSR